MTPGTQRVAVTDTPCAANCAARNAASVKEVAATGERALLRPRSGYAH